MDETGSSRLAGAQRADKSLPTLDIRPLIERIEADMRDLASITRPTGWLGQANSLSGE